MVTSQETADITNGLEDRIRIITGDVPQSMGETSVYFSWKKTETGDKKEPTVFKDLMATLFLSASKV